MSENTEQLATSSNRNTDRRNYDSDRPSYARPVDQYQSMGRIMTENEGDNRFENGLSPVSPDVDHDTLFPNSPVDYIKTDSNNTVKEEKEDESDGPVKKGAREVEEGEGDSDGGAVNIMGEEIPPKHDGPKPFSHGFWDQEVAHLRKTYMLNLARGTLMIIVALWIVLPLYWGANWKNPSEIHNLNGIIVDFDGGPVGAAIVQAFQQATGPPTQLSWYTQPASDFPNGPSDVGQLVLNRDSWFAVSINPGASANLANAIATADPTYNGSLAVTGYGEEARSEEVYDFWILPNAEQILVQACQTFAIHNAKSLAANTSISLINLLATAPTVVTQPLFYTIDNLRPFDVPVAIAVDFVGMIYLLILSFIATMLNYGLRQPFQAKLNLRSTILMRLAGPAAAYFFISWFFALVSLAYKVPFDRNFGHVGFFIYWCLGYCGMLSLGLAVEAVITVLTPQFIAFFLILWIIVNVSVSLLAIETMPSFYRYGYAAPFYNISNGVRTIVFRTKNQLGQNFGVLFAWIAISLITIPLLTAFYRRREVRAARKAKSA